MISLVVLGDPVAHSRSPLIQAAALETAGIEGSYVARRVGPQGMWSAAEEIRSGDLDGANITMPHKQLASDLADHQSELVRRLGAANTWWRSSTGRLHAENTDVDGVRFAYERIGSRTRTLVLGAGGAAAAAVLACADLELFVSARRPETAHAMLDQLGVAATVVPWESPIEGAVLINATALGMKGEPLPELVLKHASGLVDMPYGRSPTPSETYCERHAIPYAHGLEMLVGQAVASFQIWTGVAVDPSVMKAALAGTH